MVSKSRRETLANSSAYIYRIKRKDDRWQWPSNLKVNKFKFNLIAVACESSCYFFYNWPAYHYIFIGWL